MSKLSDVNEVGVISGANYKEIEDPYKVVTCFWCDRKPIKGRTSCAYHVGGTNVKVNNPHGDNYPIGYKPE